MEVLRTLVFGDQNKAVNVYGTWEKPLFLASDVGSFLGLTNVRASNLNEDERVLHSIYTPGGLQQCTFLTARGLYELLGSSRKAAAKPFRKWVGDVIESIRITGRYDIDDHLGSDTEDHANVAREVATGLVNNRRRAAIQLTPSYINLHSDQVYLWQVFDEYARVHLIGRPDMLIPEAEHADYAFLKIGNQGLATGRQRRHCSHYQDGLLLDSFETKCYTKVEKQVKESWKNELQLYEGTHKASGKREVELLLVRGQQEYDVKRELILNTIWRCEGCNPGRSTDADVRCAEAHARRAEAEAEVRKARIAAELQQATSKSEAEARMAEAEADAR